MEPLITDTIKVGYHEEIYMNEQVGNFLANQLYPDIKSWAASLGRMLSIPVKKANAPRLQSPNELLEALKKNQIAINSWVNLDCRPSAFGPFLRTHMLTPIYGSSTDMRLGPPLLHDDPIMGMMAQITSHLKPVGLYPTVSSEISQICLYPRDVEAFGFVGMMPGVSELVQYLPALVSPEKMLHLGAASTVKGIIRCVTPEMLIGIGISQETWEELRQSGSLWYLDVVCEGSEISPLGDAIIPEMWGALYASGHIEFEGELQLQPIIDGMAESLRLPDMEIHCTQNQAGRGEWLIYSRGIRAVIDTKYPMYSIHMDAEIGLSFKRDRDRFDKACMAFHGAIKEAANVSSVKILNEGDLDFTYTDSTKTFKVLTSQVAEQIADPVGMAIRDWHRKRSKI